MSDDGIADIGNDTRVEQKIVSPDVMDQPAFVYLSPEDVRQVQINEAEIHQRIVNDGRCWEFYPLPDQTDLPCGSVTPTGVELRTDDPLFQWDNYHRSTFIELIGRWSAAMLPEIAQHIGKPLFECQHYLNMLKGHPRCIDTAEIPAAEEVPAQFVEPDIVIPDPPNAEMEERPFLFQRNRLEARFQRQISPETLVLLESMVTEKLKIWLGEFVRQYRAASHICKDQSKFIEEIVMAESEITFPEWLNSEANGLNLPRSSLLLAEDLNTENDQEQEVAFGISVDAPTELECSANNQSEPSQGREPTIDELIEEEDIWLESLDHYNSTLGMLSRGLPAVACPPPSQRSTYLEMFMRAR